MQHVNNDMDDLFRRAAENYPLDTGSGNWNLVLAGLQEKQVVPLPAKKNHNRRFLFLLLLLPLYLICNRPSAVSHQSGTGAEEFSNGTNLQSGSAIEAPGPKEQNTGNAGDVGSNKQQAGSKLVSPVQNGSLIETSTITAQGAAPVATKVIKRKQAPGTNKNSVGNAVAGGRIAANVAAADTRDLQEQNVFEEDAPAETSTIEQELFRMKTTHIDPVDRSLAIAALQPERNDLVSSEAAQQIPVPPAKQWYIGIMAGTDLTTIKMQQTRDAGFEYGLLAGCEWNPKWSVEAGVFLTEKSYYTHGRYLRSAKVYRPANAEITDVEAQCRMIDLSLGAKYNFYRTRQSSWFATAGLSSYFMKKEDYSYMYYYPQTGVNYLYEHTYTNETRNMLSIANLSVGYSRQLGSFARLRIEPYVKIPIRGLGFGELPLLSTGIRAGFTRKLF